MFADMSLGLFFSFSKTASDQISMGPDFYFKKHLVEFVNFFHETVQSFFLDTPKSM